MCKEKLKTYTFINQNKQKNKTKENRKGKNQ